jgi:hypothetical protein
MQDAESARGRSDDGVLSAPIVELSNRSSDGEGHFHPLHRHGHYAARIGDTTDVGIGNSLRVLGGAHQAQLLR